MAGKHGVLSSDGHIDLHWLPGDVFSSAAPAAFKDRVPRLVDGPECPEWRVGDRVLAQVPSVATKRYRPGMGGAQIERMAATGLYSMSWIPHYLWRMDTIARERGEFD